MTKTQLNKTTVLVKRILDALRYILITGIIVWPLIVTIVGLHIPSDPEQRHTDVSHFLHFQFKDHTNITTDYPQGLLIIRGSGEVYLNNTEGNLAWWISGLITETMLLVALYGLTLLRKIFASLLAGETFSNENSSRLERLGWLQIGVCIIYPFVQYFGGRLILQDVAFANPGITLNPGFQLNLAGILVGLSIIVLSNVIREAAEMRRDQALTI